MRDCVLWIVIGLFRECRQTTDRQTYIYICMCLLLCCERQKHERKAFYKSLQCEIPKYTAHPIQHTTTRETERQRKKKKKEKRESKKRERESICWLFDMMISPFLFFFLSFFHSFFFPSFFFLPLLPTLLNSEGGDEEGFKDSVVICMLFFYRLF